ncbi:M23 family metallopeptidase [Pseudomonas sp. EpS/L25]|uniref:M23 family metallopeptidase n=1 Tax=Pseudomonas sp. EpS/L25 TaxID=1749078 RepID=UPI00074392C6|nr:peptidoglycan DD-metalloendopeptidase family protein [Pseudomonas sp. EpS/L25]KUM39512.1 peptidase M23 [Pseudomonas sp. EpS/L25]
MDRRLTALITCLTLALAAPVASQAAESSASSKVSAKSQARKGQVKLKVRTASEGRIFEVRNDFDVPVRVELRLQRTVNVAGAERPIRQVIEPRSTVQLAVIRKRQQGFPMHFDQSFSYSPQLPVGSLPPTADGTVGGNPSGLGYGYAWPWRQGVYYVTQGAGGDFSHNTPKGRYAVDIAMPEGTPIAAARAGTVIEVENGQFGHGPSPSGNFVRIAHEDGSQSAYLHLRRGSVKVRPGERVEVGTPLAESGNTGRSTGPHLHFVVQAREGGELVSIPFRFVRPLAALPNMALGDR